jgi:uncharacterized integral membrane protein
LRIIKAILFAIVAVLGLSFSALNSGEVVVDYYVGSRSLPLSIWLVIAFALGVGVAGLGCWRRGPSRRRRPWRPLGAGFGGGEPHASRTTTGDGG